MRWKIFVLKCRVLKHKLRSVLWKVIGFILMPFALLYGIIVGAYGIIKGMTRDEILQKFLYGPKERVLNRIR